MIRFALFVFVTTWPVGATQAQSFHKATAPAPAAGSIFVFPERIPLKAGGMFTCQRGMLFAPLVRGKEDSDVVAVEFFRFPRSDKATADTPPIFILNGGPGFPGLGPLLAKRGRFEQEISVYLDISDVVVVGQRGIGSSRPNTLIEQQTDPQPADQPYDDERAVADLQKVLAQERQFWIDQGVDLTGYNVLECAADVHDIAKGLGFDKITIMGGSFGSHWGMTLMRSYPDLIKRAVLHGMEGPDHTWDHPGWFWNVYKRVAEDAEASPLLKDLMPSGGLIQAVTELVARAEREPFLVTLNEGTRSEARVLINGYVMRRLARGYSGSLHQWPLDIIQMHNGEFEKAARWIFLRSRMRSRQTSTASYWMLDSGSGITAKRRAKFESDPALSIIGSTFWQYSAGSPVWETDLGDEFRQNFKSDIPTVVVHGTWDTSTPYENAQELVPYFSNSKFVSVQRGSHGAIGEATRQDSEFGSAILNFVANGDMSGLPDRLELPTPKWATPKKPTRDD